MESYKITTRVVASEPTTSPFWAVIAISSLLCQQNPGVSVRRDRGGDSLTPETADYEMASTKQTMLNWPWNNS